ncbi:MAG TPA: PAS domain S-box protein, partial [Thermomicrobiaceae bacterium]|nr:PAS domain S-box protein [Thermomicrobiaceae bacterium]
MSLEFFGHALRSFFSSRAAEPPRSVGVDVFPGIGDPWPLNGEDDEMAEELARMQERIVELETAASGAGQLRLELDRSRRRLFEIAESISDGLFVLDREWKYRYANERAAQLVARSRDDLVGSCIWDILSAAEHFQLSAEAHRAMEERVPVQVETYSRPLGIWFEAHLYPFSDGLVCYARDITDRKRSEAETGRLAAIVTSSTDAIVAKTLDGTITVWNPAAQLLYGYSVEEAVGRSIALIVPPERSAELDWIMEQVGRGERVVLPETVRRRKDGSLIDVAVSVSPILDQAGQVVGAAAITRDVRERKRTEAERALLLAHEREMRARATQLQTLTAALAGATTEAEVIDVILTHGVASLGAQTGVICFLADDGTALELARAVGYVPAELARWARIPLTDPSPRAEVARTGQPVWVDSWDCLTSRYPDTARSFATAFEATAMLPLKVDGKTVGVLGFHFPDPQPFSTADRGFLLTLAAQCAQALHRARMY